MPTHPATRIRVQVPYNPGRRAARIFDAALPLGTAGIVIEDVAPLDHVLAELHYARDLMTAVVV